jgi:hypothetical protein
MESKKGTLRIGAIISKVFEVAVKHAITFFKRL